MDKIRLDRNWKLRRIGEERWLDAIVPGSVFQDLLRAGIMQDPYYRDNEEEVEAHAVGDYEYRTSFEAEEAWLRGDAVELVCEGLNTLAFVELNGVELARTDNMHRKYVWDVRHLLHPGGNTLRIVFHSSLNYIRDRQRERPIWGQFHTLAGFPHLRKASYMFGWDWGPVIPDMGIWQDIYVRLGSRARLADVHVRQHHEPGQVNLTANVQVEGLGERMPEAAPTAELEWRLTAPDGSETAARSSVQASGRAADVSLEIAVRDPKLWWPNGLGTPALYKSEMRLLVDGVLRDERKLELGLREIRLRTDPDEEQDENQNQNEAKGASAFTFVVNGVPIFAKGANYIPEDNFTGRYSAERTERLIRDSAAANFNMIRVWGGGLYPSDSFYELCDRYGLIVWQDFMFACANYSLDGGMRETIREEAVRHIRRLRHHACLGLWCGNNEIEMAWCEWGIPEDGALRRDHVALFEELLPELVARHDPDTAYWPSSPSSGGGFDDPTAEHRGDAHYWDVWHGLKPFADYRKYRFRFVSEFGFQSFPSLKTVESFTLPEDRNIFSYVMEKHQKNDAANGKILYYLSETFRYPKDFDSLLYASQLLQGEAIRYGVEHWRRIRGRCMGTLYWQLNDCWPVASWASIDYFGRWKALHYYAKRFYAPELVSAEEEGAAVRLWLTNDRAEEAAGMLRWQLRDAGGTVLEAGELEMVVAPLSSVQAAALDYADRAALNRGFVREHYASYQWVRDGQVVSEGSVLLCPPKHFQFRQPRLEASVAEDDRHWRITVCSDVYVKAVELDFQDADVVWEDNYFDLHGGNAGKTLTVAKADLPYRSRSEVTDRLQVRCLQHSYV